MSEHETLDEPKMVELPGVEQYAFDHQAAHVAFKHGRDRFDHAIRSADLALRDVILQSNWLKKVSWELNVDAAVQFRLIALAPVQVSPTSPKLIELTHGLSLHLIPYGRGRGWAMLESDNNLESFVVFAKEHGLTVDTSKVTTLLAEALSGVNAFKPQPKNRTER